MGETKLITKSAVTQDETDARTFELEGELTKTVRKSAQKANFEQIKNLLIRDTNKSVTRTFTRYTKELVKDYINSPASNIENLRQVSNFLWRVSSSYRKIIEYIGNMPLYYYNMIYISDWIQGIDQAKFLKSFQEVSKRLSKFNLKGAFPEITIRALRDGIGVALVYDAEDDGVMFQYLDPKYCAIGGKTEEDNYYVKFDATYFDSGNNKQYIEGVNKDGEGVWDQCFIDGYNTYKSQGNDFRWFDLPYDRTICLITGDDPEVPLPYFITIFTDLLDIIDYQNIVRSKTELQNFCLLYSKIPLIEGSEEIDDFALDLETVKEFQLLLQEAVPELVGLAFGASELSPITFRDQNNTDDTDIVAQSISNLMSKVGISEMLWNSDKGGSVGLDASIKTDEAFAFVFVEKLERWMNSYIHNVISEEFDFYFHYITRYSQNAYIEKLQSPLALGSPNHLDIMTAMGDTPFRAMNKMYMESVLDFSTLWVAPKSAWNSKTSESEVGTPKKDDGSLTDEGLKSRDKNKNQGTKAKKNMK